MTNDWNRAIIDEFHANGGKVGGRFVDATLVLLITKGAKSGREHTTPLVSHWDGDRLVVVASLGGAPTNPSWYYNLLANPEVNVELGTEKFKMNATVATGEERDRLYQQQVDVFPAFADYEKKTTRKIPVLILSRAT